MAFSHYAKIKSILLQQPSGWYIKRIDEPTAAKTFKGEIKTFDHYYRIYDCDDKPIKFCKFQQLDLLSSTLRVDVSDLPVVD